MKSIPFAPHYTINEDGTQIINTETGKDVPITAGGAIIKTKSDLFPVWHIPIKNLVACTYLADPEPGEVRIIYKNGDQGNNHWENLEWAATKS